MAKKIESFNNLKHGDKIISPIDCEVTGFCIDKDGEKYLTGRNGSLFPYFQFDANDFYYYTGYKEVGEYDEAFFEKEEIR